MKICILGAGSLGSAIGGMLAADGCEVTLVNRNQAHVDAINRNGLVLLTPEGEDAVPVHAARTCVGLAPADLVVVLVKSFHTRAAIESAADVIGPKTVVMSLQNGLGHEDILSEVVGRARVIAGKTYAGGMLTEPGYVITRTVGKETIIGELDGSVSERVKHIAEVFNHARIPTIVSDNIIGMMWDKLLINVATGALGAITGLPYGELYQISELEACAIGAVVEAMAVAQASNIKLSIKNPRDAWTKAGAGLPAEFKVSMLQSLEKGSATEVDYINGSIVRAGKRLRIPTPINETLVACVKGVERRMLSGANVN